jgi:translation initiation factor 4E
VWEDDANKKGGKWIMRLKKGVCDRYWEDLLMAMVGDQFNEASDEVCGAVLSVRAQEDVLSIWTKNDGGRNVKIRSVLSDLDWITILLINVTEKQSNAF